jgi:hypothetical protein
MNGLKSWLRWFVTPLALLTLLWMISQVHAQQGVPGTLVQQSATQLNAATKFCTTTATVNSQVTCTMTPSGGNSVYLTSLDLAACQSNTGGTAISNATFTSTNITGSPVWQISLVTTANTCSPVHTIVLPTPLKASTPGTAVTIVSPAANTQVAFTITASWYEAP